MIEIQPVLIAPTATTANLQRFWGAFPIDDESVTIEISLNAENGETMALRQVIVTADEYNSWGEGETGDEAMLALCLNKLNIQLA